MYWSVCFVVVLLADSKLKTCICLLLFPYIIVYCKVEYHSDYEVNIQ
jgi:hypothetical protein